MWWAVVQTAVKEVHVYPLAEEREHILDGELCNCMPAVKQTIGGLMVVHKGISRAPIELKAHWIHPCS